MSKWSVSKGLGVACVLMLGAGEAWSQRVQQPAAPQAAPPQQTRTAQQARQPQQRRRAPPAQVIATHGSWQVQCTDIPVGPPPQQQAAAAAGGSGGGKTDRGAGGTDGAAAVPERKVIKQCGMLQNTKAAGKRPVSMTLVMGTAKQNDKIVTMMRILVPIGVYLPLGIALEIDGNPVGRVPFTRCMPQICTAVAEATPETLGKMRKGAEANFIIYERPGVGITLPVSLSGFTAAHKALSSL